jgi:hypothetical protein
MTPRWIFLVPLAALFAVGTGCDKDGNGPVGPSSNVLSVSIGPATDFIKIKAIEPLSATASYSNGTTQTVQGTWGSDAPAVATVDGSGRVTGLAAGLATIFVDYEGLRATRTLRVVPDYHGRWIGDLSVTGCSNDGDFIGFCSEFPTGELVLLSLVINQTRDTVTGTTDFGDDLPGPVTGTILMNGQLVLSGTYTISIDEILVELTVSEWETTTADNERMTGHVRVTGRAVGVQGTFSITGDLHIVVKASPVPAQAQSVHRTGFARALAHAFGRR